LAKKVEAQKQGQENGGDYQVSRGLREAGFLLSFATALFLLIALWTFNKSDPGWSQYGGEKEIINAGGSVGAWIADLLLYLFGLLAYLLPVMIGYHGLLLLRGLFRRASQGVWVFLLRWSGFFVTLVSGTGLIHLHFPIGNATLPGAAGGGGVLGLEVGEALLNSFGLTGSTLLITALFLAGITLFTGMSWFALMDLTGKITLNLVDWLAGRFHVFLDYIAAHRAKKARTKVFKKETARVKDRQAPKIEPVFKEMAPSDRVEKERQVPIFDKPEKGDLPPISLLDEVTSESTGFSKEALAAMSKQLELKLKDFGVDVEVVAVHPGPVITRFELQPAPGVKASRITGLSKDLARAMSTHSVRVVEVIPGKSVIGLEIPNESREIVHFHEIIASQAFEKSPSMLTLALGKDISGSPIVSDLAKMPHLLVAGTTGSGKSVAVNSMVLSLLYKAQPEQVRLIMIDPKMLELSVYEGIPHLLTPVVTDMKEAANALRWSVAEMERRYKLMSLMGVRNLAGFNKKINEANKKGEPILDPLYQPQPFIDDEKPHPTLDPLPHIVIVIDELADMMMIVGKKVEELIARLAQKARAAGLHLILATQRPSVDVITGLIKANIPTRIAFQVSSKIDSRTIIDQGGAETLLGHGDMLFLPPGTSIPTRIHGAFVDDHEVHGIVKFLKQTGPSNYIEEILQEQAGADGLPGGNGGGDSEQDPLYDEAVQIVTETRRASISGVQRRLKVGYNRAARMVEAMEAAGVVGPLESNGSREVLAPPPPKV